MPFKVPKFRTLLSQQPKSRYASIKRSSGIGSNNDKATLGLWERLLPTTAILVSTGCSMAIWSMHLTNWRNSGSFYGLVLHQRVAVQVFVNVLASLLAILWSYSICTVMNWMMRRWASFNEMSLNTLRMFTLLSQARLDTMLPKRLYAFCACFWALAPLIQYLWTAALTPTITSYTQLQEWTVPRTGTGSYGFLNPRPPGEFFLLGM